METLDNRIEALKAELEKLEEEKRKNQENLTPEQRFACILHENLCKTNHTDGCGWFFEIDGNGVHDWNRYWHVQWINKVKILKGYFRYNNIELIEPNVLHFIGLVEQICR